MPNRIIKESALDSEDLDKLSNGAERLFWHLVLVADDFGRFEGTPQVIKARCFPRKVDILMTSEIQMWMNELTPNLVRFYSVNGRQYGFFINWLNHQQKRANKSKFPDPPQVEANQDDSNCNQLQSNVLGIEIEIDIRDRDRDRDRDRFKSPAENAGAVDNSEKKDGNPFEPLLRLAADIGSKDKIENRNETSQKLVQWTVSMIRTLNGEPQERVLAVTKSSLEIVRAKIESGYEVKSLWGLLTAIFNKERTKYIEGPENQAYKNAPMGSFGEILQKIAAKANQT